MNISEMDIVIVLFAGLLIFGFLLIGFSRAVAAGLNKLAAFVFEFPCRVWPGLKRVVNFVFGSSWTRWAVMFMGCVYVGSAVFMIGVLFLLKAKGY